MSQDRLEEERLDQYRLGVLRHYLSIEGLDLEIKELKALLAFAEDTGDYDPERAPLLEELGHVEDLASDLYAIASPLYDAEESYTFSYWKGPLGVWEEVHEEQLPIYEEEF